MKKIALTILLCFVIYVAIPQDNGIAFNQSSWTEIKAQAEEEGKLIFVDCYAVWCGPCKWMDKFVFSDESVGNFMNEHFVNAKIDMEKGEGIELAKFYGIKAYPTFLYLDAKGNILHRVCGSREMDVFISESEKALTAGSGRLHDFTSKFESGNNDPEFMTDYLVQLDAACMDYHEQLNAYWASIDPDEYSSESSWKLMKHFVSDVASDEFAYLLESRVSFIDKYGEEDVYTVIERAFNSAFSIASRNSDKESFDEIMKLLVNARYEYEEKVALKGEMYWASKQNDWETYAAKAVEYVVPYIWDNANELNSIAWKFYVNVEDYDMLMHAVNWADRSVTLQRKYYNMDTYAAVLYKAGHKERGKLIAEQAIEIAKADGQDFSGTEEIMEKYK